MSIHQIFFKLSNTTLSILLCRNWAYFLPIFSLRFLFWRIFLSRQQHNTAPRRKDLSPQRAHAARIRYKELAEQQHDEQGLSKMVTCWIYRLCQRTERIKSYTILKFDL